MRLKYIGGYAPNSTWTETFYHTGPLLIENGEIETDDEVVIDALMKADFVKFEDYTSDKEKQDKEANEVAAKQNKAALDNALDAMRTNGRLKAVRKEAKESEDTEEEVVNTGTVSVETEVPFVEPLRQDEEPVVVEDN